MPVLSQLKFVTPPTIGIAAAVFTAFSLRESNGELSNADIAHAMIVGGVAFALTAYGPELLK